MNSKELSGVFAAIATAIDDDGTPDHARCLKHARYLLDGGCDGLNVLGTTGEATSFSLDERRQLMTAYRDAGLPVRRMMVGTGAAAVADAVALTRHAAALGFGGALVLPPFYYKDVPDAGLAAYIRTLVLATTDNPISIYLYHYPQLSGLRWSLSLIHDLRQEFGACIAGLKDSSGDVGFSRQAATIGNDFAVFPSNEATLLEARDGPFAGCISATANLNADLCARAYRQGDRGALQQAVAIRALFDGKPLVPGVKALLGHIHADTAWMSVKPPLDRFAAADRATATAGYDAVRAKRVA